ncbi:MAG TPA: hypothetical protein PK014_13395 [Thermoanaerobaculia bacterium]|nr:hypothetical protein [Thermoanaerobaculia bacterium]HUM30968.1 hypothetical protein [Thermoanaerobaculia bacterium]HXK69372.1 hypothetical protein [Thermoanaerobaculia bacterium]
MRLSRLILAFLLLASLSLFAGAGVEASFDHGSITVGDRVTFSLSVTIPAEAETPDLPGGQILSAFEIKDYDLGSWVVEGDTRSLTQTFVVSTYSTGTFFTSPWQLQVKQGDRDVTLAVPAIPLTVTSVLSGEEEELRDIRPPISPPGKGILRWLIPAAAGTAILAFLLYFWYRRRRKSGVPGAEEPSLPADVKALKALQELERHEYCIHGEHKRHYVELTDILKGYLEGRFDVDALERTTWEMQDILRNLPVERSVRLKLKDYLSFSDLVKFAKHVPPAERGEEDLKLVRGFVEETGAKEAQDDPLP